MSNRALTTPRREVLVEAAARLLARTGPWSLTARKVAAEAGTSTQAVYTQFGSMQALVRAVIEEGFRRLEDAFLAIDPSPDPVLELTRQSVAYVEAARSNPDLFRVMFAATTLGPYAPSTPSELSTGRKETLDRAMANCQRALDDGRFRTAQASTVVFQWWSVVHGYTLLELGAYIARDRAPANVLQPLLVSLFTGLGDTLESATASVRDGLA